MQAVVLVEDASGVDDDGLTGQGLGGAHGDHHVGAASDQEAALRDNIASVTVTHLETPYAMLGMLQPWACAGQVLNFAASHDGIVCCE